MRAAHTLCRLKKGSMGDSSVSNSIEAEFARRLAGNEKKMRDRAVKKLRQYLSLRSMKSSGGFTRDEMLRIWKGLFYCMWMSDKPLVQEELAETISGLMADIKNTKTAMLFFEVFFTTMQREWKGIDRLRMDKFYLLVRCVLRRGFEFVRSESWDSGIVDWLLSILKNGPVNCYSPVIGLHYHLSDIYLEELTKVGGTSLTSEQVTKFLDPYCILVAKCKNSDLVKAVVENIFQEIVETSEVAVNLLQKEQVQQNVKEHTQVSEVESLELNVDYKAVADRLFELVSQDDIRSRNRKKVYSVVKQFRELGKGRLPLDNFPDIEESPVDELKIFEEELVSEILSLKTKEVQGRIKRERGKKRKKRLMKIMKDQLDENNNEDLEEFEDGYRNEMEVEQSSNNDAENSRQSLEIPKKKAKKKKKSKLVERSAIDSERVILGSSLKKNLSSESEDSQADIDSTVLEMSKNRSANEKLCQESQKSENIPDILQDIANSEKPKKKRKPVSKERKLLEEWLNTASRQPNEEIDDTPPEISGTSVIKPKSEEKEKKKKTKKKQKNTFEDEETEQRIEISEGNCVQVNIKTDSVPQANGEEKEDEEMIVTNIEKRVKKKKRKKSGENITSVAMNSGNSAEIKSVKPLPINCIFFETAASKVEKSIQNKHLVAVKRQRTEAISVHSPKRVSFEMSKTQVQPFRKNDKSIAVSPSPSNIAFDPRKKPDFGLLKSQKQKSAKKRHAASDFF